MTQPRGSRWHLTMEYKSTMVKVWYPGRRTTVAIWGGLLRWRKGKADRTSLELSKMEVLHKSSSWRRLAESFDLKPCSMPGPTLQYWGFEEKLASISLDLATLEGYYRGAQGKLNTAAYVAGDVMDNRCCGISLLSTCYSPEIAAPFFIFFAVAEWYVIGLTYALVSFFEPSMVWHTISTTLLSQDSDVQSIEGHSLSQPMVKSGLFVADVALALEALAIFSKYQL